MHKNKNIITSIEVQSKNKIVLLKLLNKTKDNS